MKAAGRKKVLLLINFLLTLFCFLKDELKSLIHIYNSGIEKINLPLMITVEYCGYKVTCMSMLPINDKTLIYGSSDGGKQIKTTNIEFNELMKRLGNKFNLAKYEINPNSVFFLKFCLKYFFFFLNLIFFFKCIYGSLDIEGYTNNFIALFIFIFFRHLGSDNNFCNYIYFLFLFIFYFYFY